LIFALLLYFGIDLYTISCLEMVLALCECLAFGSSLKFKLKKKFKSNSASCRPIVPCHVTH